MSLTSLQWKGLLNSIDQKKCTPFIGAGALARWLPLAREIACKWAKEYSYPLDYSDDLTKVAQFLAIQNEYELSPKQILSEELGKIKPPKFSLDVNRNTPLAVLADLNLPIYITTNYDYFIEEALRSRGREPISDFCRWSEDLKEYANINEINSKLYDRESQFKITQTTPLVYHLHGDIDHPLSMVLTEKDYIEFVIFLNREDETKVLPLEIRKKINFEQLLFVGYSLYDLSFSVIFQTVINTGKATHGSVGISVQLMPTIDTNNAQLEQNNAQRYLENYTKEMFNLLVYYGDLNKFSQELRHQLDRLGGV